MPAPPHSNAKLHPLKRTSNIRELVPTKPYGPLTQNRMLALVAVGCVAALVAVYFLTPLGGGCVRCGSPTPPASLSKVFGVGYLNGHSTTLLHLYNFSVRWSNQTIALSTIDVSIQTLAGASITPGANWSVMALPAHASTPIDTFVWTGDTPGWTNGGAAGLSLGMMFTVASGAADLSGDWLALIGNTPDPNGTVRAMIP